MIARRYRTLNTANLFDRLEELFEKNTLASEGDAPMDGHMFETFGPEIEHVRAVYAQKRERIVTIVTGDSGAWWVCAGFHYVNRVGYLIAKEGAALPDFKDFRY